MSERGTQLLQAARPVAETVGTGVALGLAGVLGITIRHHRELTHRSLRVHPLLRAAIDFEQRTLGVGDPRVWASVHRIHHGFPDGTLIGFHDFYLASEWAAKNSDKLPNIVIPDHIPNLDPFLDGVKRDDAMDIGKMAVDYMKDRVGERFAPPVVYTPAEIAERLNPTRPTYFYPREKHEGEYTYDDLARIMLGDPHSPVRVSPPQLNGVRGVATHNVNLYSTAADLFRDNTDLMPEDLQNEDGTVRKSQTWEKAAGFAIPAAGVLLRRGKFTPKDVLIALAAGSAINGIRVGFEVVGGNVTNSLGHSGMLTEREMLKAMSAGVYKPKLNPDGTVTTNTADAGWLGKFFSIITMDEVGGQADHHKYPWRIAYTTKTGLAGFRDAPTGKILEFLAENKLLGFARGEGFNLAPGETRPDMPHPAFEIIHELRARELNKAA